MLSEHLRGFFLVNKFSHGEHTDPIVTPLSCSLSCNIPKLLIEHSTSFSHSITARLVGGGGINCGVEVNLWWWGCGLYLNDQRLLFFIIGYRASTFQGCFDREIPEAPHEGLLSCLECLRNSTIVLNKLVVNPNVLLPTWPLLIYQSVNMSTGLWAMALLITVHGEDGWGGGGG